MKKSNRKQAAFTLAEVLITLAIIGVVAAFTIPSVINSYRKQTFVTQLKKSYSEIQKGFKNAMAREGVYKLSDTSLFTKASTEFHGRVAAFSGDIQNNSVILDELSKIFNYSSFDNETIAVKRLGNPSYTSNQGGAMVLGDGSYVYFTILPNAWTLANSLGDFQRETGASTKLWGMVGQITIDVNGRKEPNTTGRDLFDFIIGIDGNLYPKGGIDAAAYNCEEEYNEILDGACGSYWKNATGALSCDPNTTSSRGSSCAGRIMEEGWKMNY